MKFIVRTLFIIGFVLSSIGLLRVGYFKAKAHLAQHLMQSAWEDSEKLVSFTKNIIYPIVKPWSWADTWPVFKMTIPSIESTTLVLKDASGESLAFGPGLLTPSIRPGDTGNSFIAAHRDTHFKRIGEITKGDEILIQNQYKTNIRFIVDQIEIIDSRIEAPITEANNQRLTLVTCYPFNAKEANTPYRYLVSGKQYQGNKNNLTKSHQWAETTLASLH